MIKTLALIAGAAFALAIVCFAGAAALGGFHWPHHEWTDNWRLHVDDHDGRDQDDVHISVDGDGATASREIAWSGADALELDAPADVQFTQSPGPAKLTVSGPKDLVDQVRVSGSQLQLSDDDHPSGRLTVVMTAPSVKRFTISGDDSLSIVGFDQDSLDVSVSGHGDVTAKGKARSAKLDISGDGDVNLGQLPTDSVEADISGSGRASVAPASAADLHISGSGEIDLLTHPARVNTDVTGSGRIVESAPTAPGKAG
jgi:hypothetical protein